MSDNLYKSLIAFIFVAFSSITVSGQPKPYLNKSPRPVSFESVLPGFSSYNFWEEDDEEEDKKYDFIESYFIEELKKWMQAIRPGIHFGTDYRKSSPEHVYINYSFSSQTRLANNGVWWWNVSDAVVEFIIGGLGYKYEFSIPDFSVQGNNFSNHILYNKLLSSVTSHIISYNKSSALHLADYRSGYNEAKIKGIWKNEGCRLFEGIYEEIGSGDGNKYKLAMKYIDDKPFILYLGGANRFSDWNEGEYKAFLEPTATSNTYKAQWVMANKEIATAYISFDNSTMISLLSEHNEKTTFIKLYPTTNDNISIAGAQPTEWTGTGFALKDNYIVTNYHVVDGAKSISILGVNGSFNKSYSADVIATDKNNDLAILKINGVTIPSANIPYSVKTNTAEVGEEVFVLGYPLTSTMGDEIKLTTGVVSSKSGFQGDVSLYQISAPIQPGNSGGPLFDSKGNVIGIVSAKHRGAENVSYAIKSSYLRNLMESVVPNNILPQTNKIAAQNLSGKVKSAKNYVYYIKCSNKANNGVVVTNKNVEGNTSSNVNSNENKAEDYYKTGEKYYNGQKYVESVEWYQKAANLGHVRAQYSLGLMYSDGKGVEQNYPKAIEWYTKAANQGYKYAQFNLAKIYEEGRGGNQDYKKAYEWYLKGASQGEDHAQNSIGNFYYAGLYVKRDYRKAYEWYLKSAEQGNQYAQCNLGSLYEDGKGVEQDYKKAYEWYLKSANQGHSRAQYRLACLFSGGLGVEEDMIKASEWYQKAAKQDDTDAQFALGTMYFYGVGVEKDYVIAVELIQKAAQQGNARAQYFLGTLYSNGTGVEKDINKAIEWFQKAANNNDSYAQYSLGFIYFYGRGVEKDINKALEWFQKAADQDNADSQFALGSMYYYGIGVNQDYAKGIDWIKKAANQEQVNALRFLGEVYYQGNGVKQDYTSAESYLTLAADKGDAIAMNDLGWFYFKGDGFSLDYSKAESWYKKSIETDPSWAYPYSNMALLYAKRDKNFTEAIRYSDLAIARVGDKEAEVQAVIYGERGLVYYWKGDMEKAKMMLNKCIELNPNYLEGDYDFAKVMKSYKE